MKSTMNNEREVTLNELSDTELAEVSGGSIVDDNAALRDFIERFQREQDRYVGIDS